MRLVDIFFKNIEGQASDIRGNINKIGHIMLLAIADAEQQNLNGYFEVDGSTVINAKTNYPKLHNLLLNTTANEIARLSADSNNIILGGNFGILSIKAGDGESAGNFRPISRPKHRHTYYANCAESATRVTQYENYTPVEARYTLRGFIYHGVHT